MIDVKRAHHVAVRVTDVERARRFYEGVLGLAAADRPDFGIPGFWYQLGDVQVHLIGESEKEAKPRPPEKITPLGPHLALAVEDYDRTLAQLEEAGCEVFGLGKEAGQLFVQDPDGNVIELIVPGGILGRPGSRRR